MNFDQVMTPGDIDNGIVNVVIEIPTGSVNKIEWNRDEEIMQLDRTEVSAEPTNYGFIPQTLGGDGDELDVIIIYDKPLSTETFLKTRLVGIMFFDDEGVSDDKIIVVPDCLDEKYSKINNIDDITKEEIDKITYHFNNYKNIQKQGTTIVKGWGGIDAAKEVIFRSIKCWNENRKN